MREEKERERECVGGVSECKILMCARVFVCEDVCVFMCVIIVRVCVWDNIYCTITVPSGI